MLLCHPCLSLLLQSSSKVPMLPIYSGEHVFFYFPCRLDLCMSSIRVLWDCNLLADFSFSFCFMFQNHLWVSTCDNCLSGSGLSHSKWCFLASSICLPNSRCRYFFCCVVFHCENIPCFHYPFFIWRAFRLFPGSGYDKQSCYKHGWVHVLVARLSILWVYTQMCYYWVLSKVVS